MLTGLASRSSSPGATSLGFRVGADVDPALVKLPRQACYPHGTLHLMAYRPRPDPSPEDRPACADQVAGGGAQPALSNALAPAPARPATVQGGQVQLPQPPQPQPVQPPAFRRSDYVFALGCNEPLRVKCVEPLGVAILVGCNGVRSRRRATELCTCTEEVDPVF